MAKPLTVTLPHQLGRAEARARIERGFGRIAEMFGPGAEVGQTWSGDRLDFDAKVAGQSVSGWLEVLDEAVRMEIALPGLLSLVAGKIKGRVEQEGRLMLEKKSPPASLADS